MGSPETACRLFEPDLSALLDDELEPGRAGEVGAHVDGCARCTRELAHLARVRGALRTAPAENIPDLVEPILARLPQEGARRIRRDEWRTRLRIAATAAAVTLVVLIGAWLPGRDAPPQAALASEVVEDVRAEARTLDAYRATFSIVERGWHEEIAARRFSAEVVFEAPESFRLEVRDHTDYPVGDWPRNDVELVANPRAWWIQEPSSCPPSSLPGCLDLGIGREERALVRRSPFDGTIGLPTDLVLPLRTLADSTGFQVEAGPEIQGRTTLHIALSFREASPLISSLQSGGSWRSFYPSDDVDLWLDEATGFPLRFEVSADDSAERRAWATALGYEDAPGAPLLRVEATDFSEPQGFAPHTFNPPEGGTETAGGFISSSFEEVPDGFAPAETFGLEPFRAGSSHGDTILSYSRGMSWLKVTHDPSTSRIADPIAEEVRIGEGRWGYFRPATFRQGRSLEMFDGETSVVVETNLPREKLFDIVDSIDFPATRSPRASSDGMVDVRRMDVDALPRFGFVRIPEFLPAGYEPAAAYRTRTGTYVTATAYFRSREAEHDGLGIRITQSDGVHLLPPSPDDALPVEVDGHSARWFPRRGEIDWMEDGVYISISAPSFPRHTILGIAGSLE